MEIPAKQIIGVILLLVLFYSIYKLVKFDKDRIKKLDEIADNDSSQKQKIRIIKSRNSNSAQLSRFDKIKPIIVIIIMVIIGVTFYITVLKSNDRKMYNIFLYVSFALLIIYSASIIISNKKKKKNIIIAIKNNLKIKYGDISILPIHSNEIVKGKKTEEGNIRNKYLFSCKIEKYDCTLTGYYQEKLVRDMYYSGDNYHYRYHYVVIGFFLDYVYNVEKVELNTINSVKSIISNLSKTRVLNIKVENNNLYIKKETVLFGYNEDDSNIDTDDVKIFYDELVNKIKEKK